MSKTELYLGKSEEMLPFLEENSVDTIITDPPYGLSFMGKKWDYDVPSVDLWKECLRVLKPGGTVLIFAGSRTQHRMAVNVEDAGFILKDCIMWIYGSGFPKATDISKQLDKGHERKVIGSKSHAKKDFKENLYAQDEANKNNTKVFSYGEELITAPATPEAKLWNGWKSHGLKPAYEPIIVAMKPNDGTYANNALVHGVSGLNIDGGRIKIDKVIDKSQLRTMNRSKKDEKNGWGMNQNNKDNPQVISEQGRFPANIILDEEAGKVLDEQSGILKSFKSKDNYDGIQGTQNIFKGSYGKNTGQLYNDKGGASRFFYCAKASKSERNAGCEKK